MIPIFFLYRTIAFLLNEALLRECIDLKVIDLMIGNICEE